MASVALNTGQPVGHLLDLMGVPREWPEVYEAMVDIVRGEAREATRADLMQQVRARLGGK